MYRSLGDTWTQQKGCPASPVAESVRVLAGATREELDRLIAATPDNDTAQAIITNNALALAWHLSGGDDCQTTSTKGKNFVTEFLTVLNAVDARSGGKPAVTPGTTYDPSSVYELPQITATVKNYLPYVLVAIGVVAVATTKKRR